jgi:hypothetical protein
MQTRTQQGRALTALAAALVSAALVACETIHHAEIRVLAADPAPDAGFLESPEKLSESGHRPFDRMWFSETSDWRRFPKLYVAPVDTGHVLHDESLWDKLNIRHSKVSFDVQRLAVELRERLIAAFAGDPDAHFEILESPDEIDGDTVVVEVALVELVPNKAELGAIGLAAWGAPLEIGIPVATLTAFVARGSVAMEAQVRDAGTGRVIAMFADRETGRMRVIDLRSLTWYGNAYETMDEWGEGLVDLANTRHRTVEHPPLFTFMPW